MNRCLLHIGNPISRNRIVLMLCGFFCCFVLDVIANEIDDCDDPPKFQLPTDPLIKTTQPYQCIYKVNGQEFDPVFLCNYSDIEGFTVTNDFNDTTTLDEAEIPVGIHTITWTSKLDGETFQTKPMTVIIRTNQGPIIRGHCRRPGNPDLEDSEGNFSTDPDQCTATIPFTAPKVSSHCGLEVTLHWVVYFDDVQIGSGTGDMTFAFPIGESTVVYTAIDETGDESESCQFTVMVKDKQAPTITKCPEPDPFYKANSTDCFVLLNFPAPTAKDNCSGKITFKYEIIEPDGNVISGENGISHHFKVGDSEIRYTISDAEGNANTDCHFTVTVVDKTPPTLICKDITVKLDQYGNYILYPEAIISEVHDNCTREENLEIVLDKNTFDCTNIDKINTVTITVTDSHGNSSTCKPTVTVQWPGNVPVPEVMISPENGEICSGGTITMILKNPNYDNVTSWDWNKTPPVLELPDGITMDAHNETVPNLSYTFSNKKNAYDVVEFLFTPKIYNKCILNKIPVSVIVNPQPKLLLDIDNVTICNETKMPISVETISTVSNNASIFYSWQVTTNSLGAKDSDREYDVKKFPSILTELKNTSNSDENVTYTLIPSLHLKDRLDGCISPHRETVTITVMPTPAMNVQPVENTICNNQTVKFSYLSLNKLSEKGLWESELDIAKVEDVIVTPPPSPLTLPPSKDGNDFDQTFTNKTVDGQTVYYTFKPKIQIVQNGKKCEAPPEKNITVAIHVNPTPVMTAKFTHRDSICYNDGVQINLESPNGQLFDKLRYKLWKIDYNAGTLQNVANPVTADFSGKTASINQLTLENISNTVQTVTYHIFPFIEYGNILVCEGNSIEKKVHLAPKLTFDMVADTIEYNGYHIRCFGETNGKISIINTKGGWPAKGYNYEWSENINASTATTVVTGLPAGEYSITVSDKVIGCKNSKKKILKQPDLLSFLSPNIIKSECKFSDGSITVNVTGGTQPYRYIWYGPGDFYHNGDSSKFSKLKPGNYTITVIDTNQCKIKTEPQYNLSYDTEFEFLPIGGWRASTWGAYHISCFGADDGELNPNTYPQVALSFTWKHNKKIFKELKAPDGTSFKSSYPDYDFKISNLPPGEYQLTIVNDKGCELVSEIFDILQPDSITLKLETVNMSCEPGNDGYIKALADGGTQRFTYLWSNGQVNESISGLHEGEYTVTVKDSNGCTKTESSEITIPTSLKVTAVVDPEYNGYHIDCYDNNTGKIALNIQNGRGEYMYEWNTGETTDRLDNVKAGIYSVKVTDKFNCEGIESVTLTQPNPLNEGQSMITHVTCPGEDSGSIQAKVEGGVEPYHYFWTNYAGDTSLANHLTAGTYQLQVIDSNNCNLDFSTFTISEPQQFNVDFDSNEAFCPEMSDGEIRATVSGGTKPYTYQWKEIVWGTSPNVADLRPGVYSLVVTDANSCKFTANFELGYRYVECLRIPNAFSPNDDGINDRWEILVGDPNSTSRILLRDMYPDAIVEVYAGNWGMLLYRSQKGYPEPWDGKYKGKYLPVNSYVYRIILDNHTKPITGNVTIIR